MFELFGVDSIEKLKGVVAKCTFDDRVSYRGRWPASAILNFIKVEEIGTIN